jgi:hypothetical protein
MSLRVRRHYKLFVMLALVAAVLILGLGDQRIIAYSVQGSEAELAVAAALHSIARSSTYLASTPVLAEPASLSR